MRVCLDSNVFIAIKDKEANAPACEKIVDAIENKQMEGVVSTIVLSEVEVGYYMNKEYSDAQAFAIKITTEYVFIPVLDDVAIEGAKIRALTGMRLPDALISATAQKTQCDYLITTDIPLFKKSKYKVISPTDFASQLLLDPD